MAGDSNKHNAATARRATAKQPESAGPARRYSGRTLR